MFSHIFKGGFLTPFGSHPPNFSVELPYFETRQCFIYIYYIIYYHLFTFYLRRCFNDFPRFPWSWWRGHFIVTFVLVCNVFFASPPRLHPLARPLLAAEAFWKCRRTSFILFPSWLSLGSLFLHDSFLKVLGEPVSQKL